MTSAKGVGIPIKLMHEAEGHVVTVRTNHQLSLMLARLLCTYKEHSAIIMVHRLPQLALTLNCHSQAELKSGESYRGELFEAEDNWNVQLKNVTATAKVTPVDEHVKLPRASW